MQMRPYLLSVCSAVLLVGLLLTGCDSTDPAPGVNEGRLRVLLTDAPGDILQALVTVERVAIVPAEDTAEGDASEGGIELLSDSARVVDLVELQDGVTATLADLTVPAGTYSQIRFVTADTATVLYEGSNGDSLRADLKQPSAAETGIKINFEPVTIGGEGDLVEVLLDFDVADSFVRAGRSGMYIFKPVVKAQAVTVNQDTTTAGN